MTLVEICEPVFQFICRFNRLVRKGQRQDFGIIRSELKGVLADVRAKATATPGMAGVWDKAELVLTFFADSMILNSRIGAGWHPISHELKKLGFEQEFWDILDEALVDPGEQSTQLLGVFYVCIGLGFQGFLVGQPEQIKRKQLEVAARLRGMIDADQTARLCPETYENVDTRNLTLAPNRSIAGVLILGAGLLIVVLVSYVAFYRQARSDLNNSLGGLSGKQEAKAPEPKAPEPKAPDAKAPGSK